VYGQLYDSDGAPIGEEFQINTYVAGSQCYGRLAMRDGGDFVTVWQSEGQDGSGYGIFADFGEFPEHVVLGYLQITPEEDFEPSGDETGPFTPSSKNYQLTNVGPNSLLWGVAKTAHWLALDPVEGLLEPNESTIVTVSLAPEANSLTEGIYVGTSTFTDITNQEWQRRRVTLTVGPGRISLDPGSFAVRMTQGCRRTETLTIGNEGLSDLNFTIRTRGIPYGPEGSEGRIDGESTATGGGTFSVPKDRDFMVAGNTPYKPGELIVRFAARPDGKLRTMAGKNQILGSLGGGNIKRDFNVVPGLSVVELPANITVEEALKTFNKANGIVYAQPNYQLKAISTFPNDPNFDELWGMHNMGQTGGTLDADIDAPQAWDIVTGSSQIIVAVIDTGVDYTHPDLAGNMWVNEAELYGAPGFDDDGNGYVDDIYGYDFCNNDSNPMDDRGHGTHCAGTVGAVGDNGEGVTGVCWNVRIMALKFLDWDGYGWSDDAISCVEYSILMGANLSSNSWGGGSYNQALKDAIDAAGAAGMLFVAAAGNDDEDTDVDPHYPSSYDSESIISVMATNDDDERSIFSPPAASNYGATSVDIGAPGSAILSCEPGGGYQYHSGTSMATPHVAGACVLLWSMDSALSNSEVKDILLRTVDKTLGGLCVSGGRLNLHHVILEAKAPGIEIEPEEGTIGPGESNDISVTFNAVGMTQKNYKAEILVLSDRSTEDVPVSMSVLRDDLQVSPAGGFESSGTKGGPFEPQCTTYTLTNVGRGSVNWTTFETQDWLEVDPNEGVLGAHESIDVNVAISSDANSLASNLYTDTLTFRNTESNSIQLRSITLTIPPPDCFTERFDEGGNDLCELMLTFTPDGTTAYYEACIEGISEFPTDPGGGTYVPLWDDDFVGVLLNDYAEILFYGQRYNHLFIGSNGYITFGNGETEFLPSLVNHFNMPRISGLFADLNPSDGQCISYKQLDDRVAVTYEDVPLYGDKTAKSSFQVEMFLVDGTIRITWLDIAAASVVGLSEGTDIPGLFRESDLNSYILCYPRGDFNKDYLVNFVDFAVLVNRWLETDCDIPYWCGGADLTGDGNVDWDDLRELADNWLAGLAGLNS
jgi:subtilisin family serine protease